jgi:hypothetical protein
MSLTSEPPRQRAGTAAWHLVILSAFALAQPIFELLTKNATFLAVHRAHAPEVLILVLVLILVAPLPLILLEMLAGLLGRRARHGCHLLLVLSLLYLILQPSLLRLDELPDLSTVPLAVVLAGLGTWVYARFRTVQRYLSYLAVAIPLFCALFLLNPRIGKILRGNLADGRGPYHRSDPLPSLRRPGR